MVSKELCMSHQRGKKKITDEQLDHLIGKLSFNPSKYGYNKGFWTGKLVVDLIYKSFNIKYSISRVRELLKEIGFSYKRPRMTSNLFDIKEQKQFIEEKFPSKFKEIIEKAEASGRKFKLLCLDEASIRRDGTLHNGWFLKGLIPEIEESNGRFESIKLIGVVDPLEGDISLKMVNGRMTKKVYRNYLKYLSKRYSDYELLIVDDNAPWHSKTHIIEKDLINEEIINIHIIRLPKYSPKMNPCEKLWHWLRETVTHCRYYDNISQLKNNIWRFYRMACRKKDRAIKRFKTEISLFKNISENYKSKYNKALQELGTFFA